MSCKHCLPQPRPKIDKLFSISRMCSLQYFDPFVKLHFSRCEFSRRQVFGPTPLQRQCDSLLTVKQLSVPVASR